MTSTDGVSTLVASAKIGRADGAPSRERGTSPFDGLSIGQNLKLQVLRELEQHRYEVTFGGRRHVVESRVRLSAGTQIEAQVEAKGDRLELRYLSAGPRFELPGDAQSGLAEAGGEVAAGVDAPLLDALAARYRVTLDAEATSTIARSAAQAKDPELMTRGGLFLQKLVQRVSPKDLDALYRALAVVERHAVSTAAQPAIDVDNLPDLDDFATTLADAVDGLNPDPGDARLPAVGGDTNGRAGADDDAQRALRLLNIQDEGSVAWRYGTLPLLVGGQLIELDLVMFRERESHAARGSLRRLVMTLDTTHFGRVRVEARAVDHRLIVKLSAPHADAVEALAAYGAEVRAAIEQLGWSVDDVRYELDGPQASAAQAVVNHVLSTGSVDREL